MHVKMKVKNDNPIDTWNIIADKETSEAWEEVFSLETHCLADAPRNLSATQYAQMVVDYFNATLKPGECERRLISAEWTWDPERC